MPGFSSLVVPASAITRNVIGPACEPHRRHRSSAPCLLPRLPRLHRPRQLQGRGRGHKIQRRSRIDTSTRWPPGVEAYERQQEGKAPSPWRSTARRTSTALAAKLTEDRHPRASPRLRQRRRRRRQRATRTSSRSRPPNWSKGAAAVDFAKKQLGGSLKATEDRLSSSTTTPPAASRSGDRDLATKKAFAQDVRGPAAGVDGRPGARHRQRYRRTTSSAHLFGGGPACRSGVQAGRYPRCARLVSFVWGAAEANIRGRRRVSASPRATTPSVRGRRQGLSGPRRSRDVQEGRQGGAQEMDSTVFYNRGVLIAALHVRGHPQRAQAKPDGRSPGEEPRRASRRSATSPRRASCRRSR